MEFTKEQPESIKTEKSGDELREKAKAAQTVEELAELIKAENIEMAAEEVERIFAALHKNGELADEELDNVSGGCGPDYKYDVGDTVIVNNYSKNGYKEWNYHRSYVITQRFTGRGGRGYYGNNTNEPYDRALFYEYRILGKGQVYYGPDAKDTDK